MNVENLNKNSGVTAVIVWFPDSGRYRAPFKCISNPSISKYESSVNCEKKGSTVSLTKKACNKYSVRMATVDMRGKDSTMDRNVVIILMLFIKRS
jgi:hypothetical protein